MRRKGEGVMKTSGQIFSFLLSDRWGSLVNTDLKTESTQANEN